MPDELVKSWASSGVTSAILEGFRIIELSAFVAAPLGGATLAALGADVIRVDPPGGGVDMFRWPVHRGSSLYWAGLNQGKRSVTIDTRTELGQRQVARLIAAPGEGGGILLTNLPVKGWNSYDRLVELRPDLIMVVITGDHHGQAAVDYTVNAAIGFPWLTGPENHDGPVNHVLPAWDGMTGYLAGLAILAAERHRRLHGKGQLVELSLSDVALAMAGHLGLIGEAILEPEPRRRFGNDVYGTFGTDFRTRDRRHVVVLALTARQWASLGEATGLGSAFSDLEASVGADFRREGDRWIHRKLLFKLLGTWIGEHDLAEVREAFERHGVLWSPYQTVKQLVAEDARASTANPMFAEVEQPGLGRYLVPGSPLRFGAAARVPPRRAPALGEHTEEVFREFGLDS
ncbi:MAG TPA: CoA transferase [Candidatus Micrarchaeaceae archaeon]|nr:CoA transferase [Candidatus Micrarchaeaceae archaeon]